MTKQVESLKSAADRFPTIYSRVATAIRAEFALRFAASQEKIFVAECRKNKGLNINSAENRNENDSCLG
ncbi:hypothetical protein GL2_24770 [Microbulbifer sp. GL-2]|nr:hypothetical protein GL2_24770 [Microbulbifer sp. GL-2]